MVHLSRGYRGGRRLAPHQAVVVLCIYSGIYKTGFVIITVALEQRETHLRHIYRVFGNIIRIHHFWIATEIARVLSFKHIHAVLFVEAAWVPKHSGIVHRLRNCGSYSSLFVWRVFYQSSQDVLFPSLTIGFLQEAALKSGVVQSFIFDVGIWNIWILLQIQIIVQGYVRLFDILVASDIHPVIVIWLRRIAALVIGAPARRRANPIITVVLTNLHLDLLSEPLHFFNFLFLIIETFLLLLQVWFKLR